MEITVWPILQIVLPSITLIIGLFEGIRRLLKLISSPRFIIGVLPSETDRRHLNISIQEIYKPNLLHEAEFNPRFFAPKIRKEKNLQKLKKNKFVQTHRIVVPQSGESILPIIIQNIGRSETERLKIIIRFSNLAIRLLDLKTESVTVESLYSQEPEGISNSDLKKKVPDLQIREIYNEYELTGEYIGLIDSLSSKAFAMYALTAKIPDGVKEFFVIFRLECSKAYPYTALHYAQLVKMGPS